MKIVKQLLWPYLKKEYARFLYNHNMHDSDCIIDDISGKGCTNSCERCTYGKKLYLPNKVFIFILFVFFIKAILIIFYIFQSQKLRFV